MNFILCIWHAAVLVLLLTFNPEHTRKHKMVHIFVQHAEDAQSSALAALIKHCDAQTHRQFQFLVVDDGEAL